MKTITVNEAEGAVLDWLVAKCEYLPRCPQESMANAFASRSVRLGIGYSTNPAQAWPIIDREGINLRSIRKPGHSMDGTWLAMPANGNTDTKVYWVEFLFEDHSRPWARGHGPTSLIAAMRCYVSSKLGGIVEIPEELV